ncbi:MAG TPA: SRPBCC domain-containing protein [Candidatus Bathyarchaeia archaeon]|nr:SRPBCC domain-containing protein [Candidatus Bathyarchaeia archaeon]
MSIFDTPIIHKTLIKADRKKVYDAITTANGLDGWFTKGSIIDRKPGGKIIFKWVDWGPDKVTTESEAPILEVKVPERFVFKWWEDHYTTVEMDFKEVDEGTIITLKEHGYEDTKEGHKRCLECATGWGEALTLLKFYVEHGLKY